MISIYGNEDQSITVVSDKKTKRLSIKDGYCALFSIEDILEIESEFMNPCWAFTVTPLDPDALENIEATIFLSSDTIEIDFPEDMEIEWSIEQCLLD